MRVPRGTQRGLALVTAMLLAALLTAAVVALATHQSLEHRRISNLLTADREALLLAALESAAGVVLAADQARGNLDAADEAWATEPLSAVQADVRLEGHLSDLLGRFNLTNLSPEPGFGGLAGQPDDAQTPPDVEGTDAGGLFLPEDAPATLDGAPEPLGVPTPPPLDRDGGQAGAPQASAGSPLSSRNPAIPPGPELTPAQRAEQQFRTLLKALELDETPVQAILDWVDPDNETRFPNGAEDDYYSRLTPAYRAANRPLASVQEMLLIRGVDRDFVARLAPFVTCLAAVTPVNVNTASAEVLRSLDPGISSSVARLLVQARDTQPFATAAAFLRHPLLQYRRLDSAGLATASQYFALETALVTPTQERRYISMLTRANRKVNVIARQQVVMSPPDFLEKPP